MSLNTRQKRRRELREEYVEQTGLIFKLPDETLLTIFKYFSTEELILVAGFVCSFVHLILFCNLIFNRTCKWFRNIAYDEELWTTIDLTSKTYSNRQLTKFFHRFPREATEILKISGEISHKNSGVPPPYIEQVNSLIRSSYSNLRDLHIIQYNFNSNVTTVNNITCLPTNLHGLYFKRCEIPVRAMSNSVTFFQLPTKSLKNSTTNFSLQQLEIFSVENCVCMISSALESLPNLCPKLVELNLNGCYRITPTSAFVNMLLSYSNTLRRLYLSETKITDDTIHSICRKLKRLNQFDIRECNQVTVNIVENLLTLNQLEILLANDSIRNLYDQKKLES